GGAIIASAEAVHTNRPVQQSGGDSNPQAEAAQETGTFQEIVVTARRRAENAQQVPIAVTVLSQQALQENNVKTIDDLQYLVPSLTVVNAGPNQSDVHLRGQGTNGNAGLPGVVLYLDEVPLISVQDGLQTIGPGLFFDLENVQVLKGPQGTLFGRNSVGG